MNKVYYTDSDIKGYVHDILRGMTADRWRPDYVVGLTRGGLVPANMISQYLDVPLETLKISLRDSDTGPESNLWMSTDAFGYTGETVEGDPARSTRGKNILIVDDINDSGATLRWLQEDWQNSCLPNDPRWANIWHNNVRFAVLINNDASEFKAVDYIGHAINKIENPEWCVFPWECWWR